MKILPYEKFTLISKNPASTVFLILKNNIKERKFLNGLFKEKEYFEGEIFKHGFSINPLINYKNSFNPIINGSIIEKDGFTLIKVTMRLNVGVLIFGIFWCSPFFFLLFIGIANFVPKLIIICLLFLIGGGCLFILPFKHEAKKAKQKLIDLLEAEELEKE